MKINSINYHNKIALKGNNKISGRQKKLDDFQKNLNLNISSQNLLNHAFTYCIDSQIYNKIDYHKFQKLEFLGDAVLSLCVENILSRELGEENNQKDNGKKEQIISNENLENFTKKIKADKMVYASEYSPEGKEYADIFEALIGVIFINGGKDGLKNVEKFLEENFKEEMLSPKEKDKSNKELLIDYIFEKKETIETLKYIYNKSSDGFYCAIYFKDKNFGCGFGKSKNEATQNAAEDALKKMKLTVKL